MRGFICDNISHGVGYFLRSIEAEIVIIELICHPSVVCMESIPPVYMLGQFLGQRSDIIHLSIIHPLEPPNICKVVG